MLSSLKGSKIEVLISIIYNIIIFHCFFLGLLNVLIIKFTDVGTPTIIIVSIHNIRLIIARFDVFFVAFQLDNSFNETAN